MDDVDWLVPHQANVRLIKSAADRLNLPMDRVVVNIQKYGKHVGGLHSRGHERGHHQFKKGDKVVCLAFGAGFHLGWFGPRVGQVGESPFA